MSDRVFWRCSRRECKATAVTVGGRVEHVRTLHTHQPPFLGEFFSSEGTTHQTPSVKTTAGQRDTQMVRQQTSAASRVRRRSSSGNAPHHSKHSKHLPVNERKPTPEKTTGEHARAVAAFLSNLVDRRQSVEEVSLLSKNVSTFQPFGWLFHIAYYAHQSTSLSRELKKRVYGPP